MTKELQNLLSLLESPNKENRDLGDILAKNFQKEFKEHFDCEIGQYKKLIKFLKKYDIWDFEVPISKITNFTLVHIDIKLLPSCVTLLKNLTSLNLSYNMFQVLPKEIIQFIYLKELYLSNNQLQFLPKEIAELQSLEILNLKANQLQSLPKELAQIKTLRKIYLLGNPANMFIPDELKHLVDFGSDLKH